MAIEPRPGHRPEGLVGGRPEKEPNGLTYRFISQANINKVSLGIIIGDTALGNNTTRQQGVASIGLGLSCYES